MNILVPHSWLLEYLDTQAIPSEIQKYVSLSGPSIERIYERAGESVYDVEVTTNRVDSMCMRGLAREAAVILTQAGIPSKLKPLDLKAIADQPRIDGQLLPMPAIHADPQLTRRVICVVLELGERAATPDWMTKRLLQIDQNVHDATIDITNYITHALGHPCHAFDYDKLMQLGGVINIVTAQPGMPFTTLDGNDLTTLGGEVVFTNDHHEIIDLPGIKGTANSSVDSVTKRVLFFIESVPSTLIRRASMNHAIRTVAAQLFEKQVDPTIAQRTLELGTLLYVEICHAKVASEVFDYFPESREQQPISVKLAKIQSYMGLEVPVATIQSILQSLECEVSVDDETVLVIPPTFRPDLQIDVDVIEEIARIYGYHNLPSVLMEGQIPTKYPEVINFSLESLIKRLLVATGWQELYTESLVSSELVTAEVAIIAQVDQPHLAVNNPLSDDKVFLRQSLIPSLEAVLNANPLRPTLSIFELANVYYPHPGALPTEQLHLTLVSGRPYREVLTAVADIMNRLYIATWQVVSEGVTGGSIQVTADTKTVVVGTVTILRRQHTAIDLVWQQLLSVANPNPTLQPVPKSQPLIEDLTFQLPPHTAVGPIIERWHQVTPQLANVVLLGVYQDRYSFQFTYASPTLSISSAEVKPLRQAIYALMAKEFSGQLIGNVTTS